MNNVAAAGDSSLDLIDLKFLPAWVKEGEKSFAHFDFDESHLATERPERERPGRKPRRPREGEARKQFRGDHPRQEPRERRPEPHFRAAAAPPQPVLPELEIRFFPQETAFKNVAAQIKSGATAYSVYALARLFLQKPERYEVRVTSKGEAPEFFQVDDSNLIASQHGILEPAAFRALRNQYYKIEVTENEPIKGNFTSVARDRGSGLLLGPTNYHAYQSQLRRLFEQRYARRMNFPEFQRQIEVVNDPALVEQWKEGARKVTTFSSLKEDSPRTFTNENDAEKDFREKYLPALIRTTRDAVIDGVSSRSLRDRAMAKVIENAWASETRSPSHIMQELSARLREAGLQIFRHRKGMLFVSPVRPKPIEESAVSDSVRAILEAIKAKPRINRKDLAEQLIAAENPEAEKMKLGLASDLLWLTREGHLIEFNDGSLDLPRVKIPAKPQAPAAEAPMAEGEAAPANPVGAAPVGGETSG